MEAYPKTDPRPLRVKLKIDHQYCNRICTHMAQPTPARVPV